MLAGKWLRQLAPMALVGLSLLGLSGITGAALGPGPPGPVPVLDRGGGHTVVLPDGRRAYRAEGGAQAISVLDSRTGEVVKTIPTAFRVDLLAISEDSRWLYRMSPRAEAIVVIDLVSDQVVGTILTRPPAPPAPAPL